MLHTVCFTGLRPHKMGLQNYQPLRTALRIKITQLIEEEQAAYFISGFALGVDQMAAQIVLELKKQYPHIVLEAALPCINQEKRWQTDQKAVYQDLLEQCDYKHYCSEDSYFDGCMFDRNKYMVEKSGIVFAVWDNATPGGTSYTVNYARIKKKRLLILDPKNLNQCLTENWHES